MAFDDPLSLLSLKKSPKWPKSFLKRGYHGHTEREIENELKKIEFNLEEWIDYKSKVPNDDLLRKYSHSKVEYHLTEDEYKALNLTKWGMTLCNPIICPEKWKKHSMKFGEYGKRYEWIIWQFAFLEASYPPLPDILWGSNKILLRIFRKLLYEPFIQYWGMPTNTFWTELSYDLEQENQELIHRGFIVTFNDEEKIFPSPDIHEVEINFSQK